MVTPISKMIEAKTAHVSAPSNTSIRDCTPTTIALGRIPLEWLCCYTIEGVPDSQKYVLCVQYFYKTKGDMHRGGRL